MISGNSAGFIASRRCSVIVSSGHSKSATGTVRAAVRTPSAKPGAGGDEPGVTSAVPLTVQVHPRMVEVPETVNSTVDCCAAAGDPASNANPRQTAVTNRNEKTVRRTTSIPASSQRRTGTQPRGPAAADSSRRPRPIESASTDSGCRLRPSPVDQSPKPKRLSRIMMGFFPSMTKREVICPTDVVRVCRMAIRSSARIRSMTLATPSSPKAPRPHT